MSQQNILLTVCLVAGFIGAAYGQGDLSINPMQCGTKAQAIYIQYLKDSTDLLQSYSQQLAQTGSSAIDTQGFADESGKLIQQFSQLGDTSNGFSLSSYAQQGTGILTQQMKLATYFMRPDLGVTGVRLYTSFISSITTLNTNFASQLTSACMSG